jgi:hypothetical protein
MLLDPKYKYHDPNYPKQSISVVWVGPISLHNHYESPIEQEQWNSGYPRVECYDPRNRKSNIDSGTKQDHSPNRYDPQKTEYE